MNLLPIRLGIAAAVLTATFAATASAQDEQPLLVINRQSGEVHIRNAGATESVAIDSYDVLSASGALNVANWTSLAPNDGWQEANPGPTNLSELNALSSDTFAAGTDTGLGNVFEPMELPFGDDAEDIQFRYSPVGEGEVAGEVLYEGIPADTLTLNVDRTTGAAQLINGFRDPVSLDTYTVTSESGSLDVTGSGFSAIGGDWQVAENEPGAVSELNPLTSLTLGTGQTQSLGNLFDFDAVGVAEDLAFEFSLPTEGFSRSGKVVFSDTLNFLPQGLAGDYNNDGLVDAADYTVWRDNLGASSAALNGNGTGDVSGVVGVGDYALWQSQFGAGSGGSLNAVVPEPLSIGIAAWAAGVLATSCGSRRRRTMQQRFP